MVLVVVCVVITAQLSEEECGLVKELVCSKEVDVEVDVHGVRCGVDDERSVY